jgi:hypothetical protein
MRDWNDSERKSAVVASLMLMHRIEAKLSSASDICATRPRSVQRRVREQLALFDRSRHCSDSGKVLEIFRTCRCAP